MSFRGRVAASVLRPIYRTFFERPLWRFLANVKTFFFAEIGVQLGNFERRFIAEDAVADQRWTSLEQRLERLEANNKAQWDAIATQNAAQWDALEQLILAVLRQPEARASDLESSVDAPRESPASNKSRLTRIHAASNIR